MPESSHPIFRHQHLTCFAARFPRALRVKKKAKAGRVVYGENNEHTSPLHFLNSPSFPSGFSPTLTCH